MSRIKLVLGAAILALGGGNLAWAGDEWRGDDDGDRFPRISGFLQVYAGGGHYSPGSDSFSTLGGGGRATVAFNPSWSVQLDAAFDGWNHDVWGSWNVLSTLAHVTYRDPKSFRVGGYVGLIDAQWNDRILATGLEAQGYFGNFSVEGRLGYYTSDGDSITNFRVAGRYFPQDNVKLELSASYSSYNWGDSGWTVGGLAEYKFGRNPFTLFAAVDHGYYNDNGGADFSVTTANVGARILFGKRSLQSEDYYGSTFGDGHSFIVRLAD